MRTDCESGTLLLTVGEFATHMGRKPKTIYNWISSGFITELGFILHKDISRFVRIGIPPQHSAYNDFNSRSSL